VIKTSILFLCTGNSRRTQMAEGFLRALAGDHYDVVSAGSEETPIDPDAVAAMREVGIDISGQESKAVNRFLGKRFSYVVTLCDREKERTCPIFPGAIWRLRWDLEDPSQACTPGERRAALRRVRDEIQRHVMEFVNKNGAREGKEQPV
jgi:arsenate reductase (thioredoxin)